RSWWLRSACRCCWWSGRCKLARAPRRGEFESTVPQTIEQSHGGVLDHHLLTHGIGVEQLGELGLQLVVPRGSGQRRIGRRQDPTAQAVEVEALLVGNLAASKRTTPEKPPDRR